jgi:hypothetical protein
MNKDEQQELTDNDTLQIVNHNEENDIVTNDGIVEKADKMSHSEGVKTIETALVYVEQ